MSEEAVWESLRVLKRSITGDGRLDQAKDVDPVRAVIARWRPVAHGFALQDAAAFFCALRDFFGGLTQEQVDGYNRLLNAMGAAGWPIAYTAYGLTTARHETAFSMKPVEEGYYLGAKAAAFQKKLRYYPWYGRGDVQLTHKFNYEKADEELGLGGRLIADPSLALDPEISAKILVRGMEHGWFTGKKLADYLPSNGPADIHQFSNARRIINGLDKAVPIAEVALKMQAALQAGGWG